MVFVFLFLTYFIQYNNLSPSTLLQMALFHSFLWLSNISVCVRVCSSLSSVWHFETPWTVASQDPLSMEFSRQECWSGLLFPPPEDLPDPGTEPRSPALQEGYFTTRATREAQHMHYHSLNILNSIFSLKGFLCVIKLNCWCLIIFHNILWQ